MENTMENTVDNTQASKGLHDEEHQQGRLGRFVELVQAVFLRERIRGLAVVRIIWAKLLILM